MKLGIQRRGVRVAPRSGGALVLSLTAMVVVSILAAAFLQLATSINRRIGAGGDSVQAFNIAEAGLAEAYTGLAVARTGNVGTEAQPAVFAGGLFWVTSEEHENGLVELQSTALYGTGRARLGIVCEPVESQVSSLGIFSGSGMTLGAGAKVDSYDSSLGTHADQVGTETNERALIGSNGDVTLGTKSTLLGDVAYGAQGQLTQEPLTNFTGGASARGQEAELPPIEVPEVGMSPALPAGQTGRAVVPAGEYGYETARVALGTELVLEGPLKLVVGSLTVAGGGQLSFDTSAGPVQLYVTGSLDLASGSTVTTSSQATADTVVMVSVPEGGTVNFGSTSKFYGFVYVPETAARIAAAYEIFGGVVGHQLLLDPGAKVHMDLALSSSLESMLPLMRGWRVVDVPQALSVAQMDPFRLLGLDKNALPRPAEAHSDQVLELKYVDLSGAELAYFGLESDFDWSQVRQVLYGARDGEAFLVPGRPARPDPTPSDPGQDLVASATNSSQLRDDLINLGNASPKSLLDAILSPLLSSSDLRDVLSAYSPLDDTVLRAAILSSKLSSSRVVDLLVQNSPLAVPVLNAALSRLPALAITDVVRLLGVQ